jgi:predicted secreted protein
MIAAHSPDDNYREAGRTIEVIMDARSPGSDVRRRGRPSLALLPVLAALAVIAASLAACGSSAPQTVKVDQTSNGGTVQVAVGQHVQVTLRENPGSGNKWITLATPGLKIDGSVFANGARTWTLTATKTGAQRFDAVYGDIGGPGSPGLPQRCDLRVTVK